MPKNKQGGKKFKSKKKSSKDANSTISRKLELRGEGQEYAKVIKNLGDRRVQVMMNDGKEVLCIIPGKFRFRVWISVNDVILVSTRDYQTDKADVIHKYDSIEVKKLYKLGEITSTLYEDSTVTTQGDVDEVIEFYDSDEKTESSDIDLDNL